MKNSSLLTLSFESFDLKISTSVLFSLLCTKACNESYEEQLPDFDSWALTAGMLSSFFSVSKGPDYDFRLCIF